MFHLRPRHLAIVEMNFLRPEYLIILVAFAREQHQITRARARQRASDRRAPVRFDEIKTGFELRLSGFELRVARLPHTGFFCLPLKLLRESPSDLRAGDVP